MTPKTVQYRVEFYDEREDDPVFTIYSATPLFDFAIGALVEPHVWPQNHISTDKVYRVTAVVHLCSLVGADHIQHSLSVYLEPILRESVAALNR